MLADDTEDGYWGTSAQRAGASRDDFRRTRYTWPVTQKEYKALACMHYGGCKYSCFYSQDKDARRLTELEEEFIEDHRLDYIFCSLTLTSAAVVVVPPPACFAPVCKC